MKSNGATDQRVKVLLEIGKAIQASLESKPKETFNSILSLIKTVVDYEFGTLFLLREDQGELEIVASKGEAVDLINKVNFDLGRGFSAWVARSQRPILLSDIHRTKRFEGDRIRCFLSVPLVLDSKSIGVMNFGHSEPGKFTESDLDLLSVIGSQISLIIEKLSLVTELRDTTIRLRETNKQLKEAQQKLIESEKLTAIGQVTASINHEINNPLTVISGNVQLLLATVDDEHVVDKLNIIFQQADKIAGITEKLRSMKSVVLEEYLPGDVSMIDINKSYAQEVEA